MFSLDSFSLIGLFVALTLLPLVAMVATSYLKIVVVMQLIRNALGIQSIPPNMVINALALILTFYIMAPRLGNSWNELQTSLAENRKAPAAEQVPEISLIPKAVEPFREFLKSNSDESQRAFFTSTAEKLWSPDGGETPAKVDPDSYYILLPSFTVTELTKAFQIGFLVYLPFIAIDIIISNILLAMGMMMVSPVTISLPFKLLLFVMCNGWTLLIQGLIQCYVR